MTITRADVERCLPFWQPGPCSSVSSSQSGLERARARPRHGSPRARPSAPPLPEHRPCTARGTARAGRKRPHRAGRRLQTRSTTSTTTRLRISSSSQNFEASNNSYDDELADDFVVPGGIGWNIEAVEVSGEYFNGPGPASSVNVNFYSNGGNNRPGSLLEARPNQAFTNGPNFSIPLATGGLARTGHVLGLGAGEPEPHPGGAVGLEEPHASSRTWTPPGRTRATASGPDARRGGHGRPASEESRTRRIRSIG